MYVHFDTCCFVLCGDAGGSLTGPSTCSAVTLVRVHCPALTHSVVDLHLSDTGPGVHGHQHFGPLLVCVVGLARWRQIPSDTDVLLTHGPPLGHGDLCSSNERAGCVDLLREVQDRVQPMLHVFGHVRVWVGLVHCERDGLMVA